MLADKLRSIPADKPRPTFVNFGAETAISSPNITVAVPSGVQNGDLLIAVISGDLTGTWNTLSGWTELADAGSRPGTAISIRTASSEPSSYTFTASGAIGTSGNGFIFAYRGASYDTIGSFGTSGGTTAAVAPSITAASANSILLGVYSQGGTSGPTFTAPSGMTLVASDLPNRPCLAIYSENIGAGSTGTRTLTSSASSNLLGILLAIKPL